MAGRIAYYGNIVTSGLVLNLDAAKRDSYPGSGTIWRDISGNGNNGTLTNGPTFNSDNYGSIAFDGVDDYVLLPNGLLSGTGDFTVNQFIKPNGSVVGTTFGNFSTGNLQVFFGTNYIGMWLNNNSTYLSNPLSQYTTNPVMITAFPFSQSLLCHRKKDGHRWQPGVASPGEWSGASVLPRRHGIHRQYWPN